MLAIEDSWEKLDPRLGLSLALARQRGQAIPGVVLGSAGDPGLEFHHHSLSASSSKMLGELRQPLS